MVNNNSHSVYHKSKKIKINFTNKYFMVTSNADINFIHKNVSDKVLILQCIFHTCFMQEEIIVPAYNAELKKILLF